jgi:hypothetical protein
MAKREYNINQMWIPARARQWLATPDELRARQTHPERIPSQVYNMIGEASPSGPALMILTMIA